MGAAYVLSTITALLAQAVAAQGRDDEAAALVDAGQSVTGEDDVASKMLLASVRSGVLVRRGEIDAGFTEARRAVELVADADATAVRADGLFALADACVAAGDHAGAAAALEQVAAECAAKGFLVSEQRARRRLELVR